MKLWPAGPRMKTDQRYQSEYEFTLIDFGIMSKFKLKKTSKVYSHHIGNLMFSSLRGLECRQTRYQDDIESLFYLAYYFIEGVLPWDIDYTSLVSNLKLNLSEQISLYKSVRLENQQKYSQMIPQVFNSIIDCESDLITRFRLDGTIRDHENPFRKILEFVQQVNLSQKFKLNEYTKR